MKDLLCPLCDWRTSELFSLDGSPVSEADSLVTQHANLVEHLEDDHDAMIGGR